MIDWWGPIIDEYYAATEGTGATFINSRRLARAPRLGRPVDARARSTSSTTTATSCRAGEVGTVWFEPPPNRPGFEYHKDEAKTRDSFNDQGWSTVGDMGYLDDDGYLFLTDRRTFMIVSGGVNIYPQEAENLLIDHPKVYDVAVFGIPDRRDGRTRARRRAAGRLGRRRARARTRAARVLPRATSRTTSARRPSTSTASSRASRPASSTSGCCATATGATRPSRIV